MSSHRFAVNVTPKPGILDPQGRAVEGSLGHLGIEGVSAVRVGRRVELTVEADDAAAARAVVERLASELLSNPLIEAYAVEELEGAARMSVRVGVVVFPGSNCDRDTAPRPDRGRRGAGRAVARAGVARRGRRGGPARRVRVWRLPAGRGHRAVQPRDAFRGRLRGRGRPRPGDLQRLPGARRGRARARGAAAQPVAAVPGARRDDQSRTARHAVHARDRRAAAAAHADRPR